ncbi:porin [Noviherbaspirillum sp. UKPF54]|uniref:porin n=1 Tax=Noviherbaspirillum sp. UKPF54 TaxID=2601898 RepID=UPI0011B1121F|nr:porin [Noviherbaspirillum sp. UKPF54]QDZ28597.1 porin [Noviherbaspirillum sp. UKPF54]
MKKLPLAFAVLAAFSGVAAAQTNVTIYGLIDGGIEHQSGGANGSLTKLTSGVQNASRIGFKGTEDLGGGMSALFTLENGFALDTGAALQNGALFGRQAFVGLKGDFGTVTLGRQYTPIFTSLCGAIDPFACGLAGNAANLMSQGGSATTKTGPRTDNALRYASPVFSGVQAEVTYGFGETAGNNSALRTISGQLGYTAGPLVARLAYNNVNDATDSAKVTMLGAKYDFGMAALHVAYAINKGNAVAGNTFDPVTSLYNKSVTQGDTRDALIGVSVPFGASTFLASYIQKKDKTAAANDAKQYAVGYTYALSKRTNLYTSYAHINNTVANNAAGFYTAGNATDLGAGNSSYNVGVRHTF